MSGLYSLQQTHDLKSDLSGIDDSVPFNGLFVHCPTALFKIKVKLNGSKSSSRYLIWPKHLFSKKSFIDLPFSEDSNV